MNQTTANYDEPWKEEVQAYFQLKDSSLQGAHGRSAGKFQSSGSLCRSQ